MKPIKQLVAQPFWQRIILLSVLGYEAAGAMLGGVLLIMAPDGHLMDMPVHIMHGAFLDFLIPGIILLGLGILNAFAFFSVAYRNREDWLMAGMANGGFIIWFVVEIIILRELHWLHLMWGLPVLVGWIMTVPLIVLRNNTISMHIGLLTCGIISSLWYILINTVVPVFYDGYSVMTLTVSELSAIGAPTRIMWVLLAIIYLLLFSAFGWGVLQSSQRNNKLKLMGILILIYCGFNLYWPPMHMRGEVPTLTDILHIVWASITVLLMMGMMILGALTFNRKFRIYTILSLVLLICFGILTFRESPNIPTNGPTPTIGLYERLNIGVFMFWVIVLAAKLLLKEIKYSVLKKIAIL